MYTHFIGSIPLEDPIWYRRYLIPGPVISIYYFSPIMQGEFDVRTDLCWLSTHKNSKEPSLANNSRWYFSLFIKSQVPLIYSRKHYSIILHNPETQSAETKSWNEEGLSFLTSFLLLWGVRSIPQTPWHLPSSCPALYLLNVWPEWLPTVAAIPIDPEVLGSSVKQAWKKTTSCLFPGVTPHSGVCLPPNLELLCPLSCFPRRLVERDSVRSCTSRCFSVPGPSILPWLSFPEFTASS